MLCLWSAKGGSGCTVVAGAIGLLSAHQQETLLVDLGGDLAMALGVQSSEVAAVPSGPLPTDYSGLEPDRATGWGIAGWLAAPAPPPDALARLERPLIPGLSLLPLGVGSAPSAFGGAGLIDDAPPEPSPERVAILAEVLAADGRRVVVDLGRGLAGQPRWLAPFLDRAHRSLLVTRACYLALSQAARLRRADGLILIDEPGRALKADDVARALGAPVVATVPFEPGIARAVDSGLLARRIPHGLRALRALADTTAVA